MSAEAVVQARLDALAAGDRAGADAALSDDVVLRVPAKSRFSGVHEGRSAVAEVLAGIDALTPEEPPAEYTRFASAERVLVFRVHGTGEQEARHSVVYRVDDGRIAEIDLFSGYADDPRTAPLRR
jgi:ketosteroid isomerase-like protein